MKISVLLLLMVFSATLLRAQQNDEKLFYLQKAEKYRRMRRTGTVLTTVGAVGFIAGIAMLANSSYTTTTNSYGQPVTTATEGNPVGGALIFLAGGAALGAGVPLWIVGSHAEKKYQRKLEGIALRVNFHQQHPGLTLTCRLGH